ncbi:hypothetical protein PanWU01x14_054990 [Parasponia andersonii]|uniref:DUF4283 domain-containing protein n=1 Tax=Parasponia andersonii TaxID=3476 RepID=A0A2P5DKX6_PARAD|nr:hypothetical protein PanWU01x14_054990 [Parasponia andersonii]
MADLWKWRDDVMIIEMEPGIILFQFGCAGDRRRVLLGESWHFNNHHIVLVTPEELRSISATSLTFTRHANPGTVKKKSIHVLIGSNGSKYHSYFEFRYKSAGFISTPFWIQIHPVPFMSKTRDLGKLIADKLGLFIEVDDASLLEGWGPYMRVCVALDVTKPLPRGRCRLLQLP